MAKVAVAMSGGVDSSVAAALLKEKGYEVIGLTMKIGDGKTSPGGRARPGCCGAEEEDIEDARRVAEILGIPFHVFDLRQEYKAQVLDYFCQEYLSGKTPNPCIRCNRRVKFGALLEKAQSLRIGFDYFATGHYAQVEHVEGRCRYLLKKAKDLKKDQSYFLFSLSQEQLSRCLFPLGNYTKEEVRRMAANFRLPVSDKPESQNFMAGGYSSLIEGQAKPGSIVDRHGNVLGEHRGIAFYTIGQRRGLGISAREPLYVTSIDQKANSIVVGSKEEVYADDLIASELNWIALEKLERPIEVTAKIRYRHEEAPATVTPLDKDKVQVKFKEPQMAITPGQGVVFYNGDILVGGGTREKAATWLK
jgi:tRNA-specific 2-thiouridylase